MSKQPPSQVNKQSDRRPFGFFRASTSITTQTKKIMGKFGFHLPDIALRWPMIVGEEYAHFATPLRVIGRDTNGKTLVLGVHPAMLAEIRHVSSLIIGRANQFYGYGAIKQLKLEPMHGWEDRKPAFPPPPPPLSLPLDWEQAIGSRVDNPLEQSLRHLARSVLARRHNLLDKVNL